MTLKIFSAPWCCNCKTVKTMLKDVPMEVVDADDENNTPIYDAADVQSIPTIIAYDEDGREVKRWSVISINRLSKKSNRLNKV